MTSQQRDQLKQLSEQMSQLTNELDAEAGDVSNLFVSTRVQAERLFVLQANAEGCLYLASILLGLAKDASQGQHYHFDETTVLSECGMPMVIGFQRAPWEEATAADPHS